MRIKRFIIPIHHFLKSTQNKISAERKPFFFLCVYLLYRKRILLDYARFMRQGWAGSSHQLLNR